MTTPRPEAWEWVDKIVDDCSHALATENNGKMYDWTSIPVACGPCIASALDALTAERDQLWRIVKGVHGALSDAHTVPVPALDADLYEAVMQIVRERDRARKPVERRLAEALKYTTHLLGSWVPPDRDLNDEIGRILEQADILLASPEVAALLAGAR